MLKSNNINGQPAKCERCGAAEELRKCPICLKALCPKCWGLGNQYPNTNCQVCEQEKWE